jgi:membrane protease subunit HflK
LLIQYIVSDPSAFLYATEEPQWLVRKVGESVLTEKMGSLGVDEILTTAKLEIEQAVKGHSQEILDSYGAGIKVVAAHLQEVAPPREVADSFREVASAREDRNRIIHEANGYLNRVVPTARGEAEQLTASAEGYRTEKTSYAEGEADRFAAVLAEYRRGPNAARERIYLEVMEEVLSEVQKYVLDEKAGEATLDLRFLSPRK